MRSPACQGMMPTATSPGHPIANWDAEGAVFAVAAGASLRIYDPRNADRGAFATFQLPTATAQWTRMRFSPDGERIVLCSAARHDTTIMLDAFDGKVLWNFADPDAAAGSRLTEAAFSPDGRFMVAGSTSGALHAFSTPPSDRGVVPRIHHLAKLESHPDEVNCVEWSPKTALVASASQNVAFWLPAPVA